MHHVGMRFNAQCGSLHVVYANLSLYRAVDQRKLSCSWNQTIDALASHVSCGIHDQIKRFAFGSLIASDWSLRWRRTFHGEVITGRSHSDGVISGCLPAA
jgi:hypothetical protein